MPARRRHSILPRCTADWCAFIFFSTACILIVLYDFFVLLPYMNPELLVLIFLVLFVSYVGANILGNFLKLIMIDTSILTVVISRHTSQFGWKYCPVCESAVPPRSHHCRICNICILRQDHHCIFSACCIGFLNHRYYMGLIVHLWLVGIFTVFFNYHSGYLSYVVGGFNMATFFYHLFPFPYLLSGSINLPTFFVLFLSAICLFGFLFVTGLLMHHWMLLTIEQTTWEKGAHITKYQCKSKMENVKNVLGKNWITNLLWFNTKSDVQGDGARFEKCVSRAAHGKSKKLSKFN